MATASLLKVVGVDGEDRSAGIISARKPNGEPIVFAATDGANEGSIAVEGVLAELTQGNTLEQVFLNYISKEPGEGYGAAEEATA